MEWKVVNANSRDVERQHLNKILQDIRTTVDSVNRSSVSESVVRNIVTTINSGGGSSPQTMKVVLQGNVTGTASGTSTITINTVVDPSILGIPDAPTDSNIYWRSGGQWQAVPGTITSLNNVFGDGIVVHLDDEGWVLREIEGTVGQIVVTDGDGIGNPVVGLADVSVAVGGTLEKRSFDSKGRLSAASAATTDDLVEGTTNAYWKEAPADGQQYVRKDSAWAVASGGGGGGGISFAESMMWSEA